tara:strand:+ start:33 stop:716 length:684 start_codon:yes stop_codon:yes gene_type:complete
MEVESHHREGIANMRSKMFSNLYEEYDRDNHTRLWLKEKVAELSPRPRTLFNDNRNLRSTYPIAGNIYLFLYEPKNKNRLRYYDRLPLIIPIDIYRKRSKKSQKKRADYTGSGSNFSGSGDKENKKDKTDSFNALNLHYTTVETREFILERLYRTSNFRSNLRNLMRYKNGKLINALTKTYRMDGLRSRFLQIPVEEYDLAMVHKTEFFKKKHKTVAWRDTRRRIIR